MGKQESLIRGPQVQGASSFFSSASSSWAVGFSSIGAAGPWANAAEENNVQPVKRPSSMNIATILPWTKLMLPSFRTKKSHENLAPAGATSLRG